MCADLFSVAIAVTGVDDRGNIFPMGLLEPLSCRPPQAWLEVGCWVNRHLVALAHVSSPLSDQPAREDSELLAGDAAAAEWASFDWPLRSVDEVKRLLACTHIAPTVLIGGEFLTALRSDLER